jgi:hypothetical protein
MITAPHRTDEMKAKYAADTYAKTQEELDVLLGQFANKHAILDRLRPHLQFEPLPLTPPEDSNG